MQRSPSGPLANSTHRFSSHLQTPSVEFLNTLEAGIWIVSLDGIIEYANPRMRTLLGYTTEEMLYRPVVEFLGPERKNDVYKNIAKRQKGVSESYPYTLFHRDGSAISVTVAANALCDQNKNVIASIAVITENKLSSAQANANATTNNGATGLDEFTFGNLQLHPSRIEYSINGERFEISHFAFKLLSYFVRNNSRVIPRSEIIQHVWEDVQTSDRVIDAHIVALRKKLKNFDGALKMVYGLGYILKLNDKTSQPEQT